MGQSAGIKLPAFRKPNVGNNWAGSLDSGEQTVKAGLLKINADVGEITFKQVDVRGQFST